MTTTITRSHNQAVLDRYADGAAEVQPALCCPTDGYDAQYLEILPEEILAKDYGCGDPSKYVQAGDVVVDLGSGVGKICYILSQKVGAEGQVIGVDFNDAMLDIAKKYQQEMAEKIGFGNVRFEKAKIQDLALGIQAVEDYLAKSPIQNTEDLYAFESFCEAQRKANPVIADGSIDVVVSNCVLNLVSPGEKRKLFTEIYRVLKPTGRAVISDIVCNHPPSQAMQDDPELWSGCISGAFVETDFPNRFLDAGFAHVDIKARQDDPWQVVQGIEFRSLTVCAYKTLEAMDMSDVPVAQGQSCDPQGCC